MNIFFLDADCEQSAKNYYNRHVVKIILEITQMLYAVLQNSLDLIATDLVPYKPTHTKHPMTIWIGYTLDNLMYTLLMAYELMNEYTLRYGKVHACRKHIDHLARIATHPKFTFIRFAEFGKDTILKQMSACDTRIVPLCMPIEYMRKTAVESYRAYYTLGKSHVCTKKELVKILI